MNSPVPTPPSPQEKPGPFHRKRRWLVAGVILGLLVPGIYWIENYTGRRSLENVVAVFEASGDSLAPVSFLPGVVPPHQNFCATALLDGIMEPYGDSPAAQAASWKRKALSDLLPSRPQHSHKRPAAASAKSAADFDPWRAVVRPDIMWSEFRTFLPGNSAFSPPADEPSDLRAVYLALNSFTATLNELLAASRRPHAVFTPPAISRLDDWTRLSHSLSYPLGSLSSLLLLRGRAAAAVGSAEEGAGIAGVVWRLARACRGECLMGHNILACDLERKWVLAAREICRAPNVTGEILASLIAQPGPFWSPEDDLRLSWRSEAATHLAQWKLREPDSTRFLFEPFDGEDRGVIRETMQRYGPIGWHAQNLARILNRVQLHGLMPLRRTHFAGLPDAMAHLKAEIVDSLVSHSPYQFSRGDILYPDNVIFRVYRAITVRVTLLAIAMERYRLKHGRYPADATALVAESIAAIPMDMDGAPLRVVTSPDGAGAVVYSIGWNLTDDWHGVIPPAYKEEEQSSNADWPLALPLPPLPPP
jgi:hypothetical protein